MVARHCENRKSKWHIIYFLLAAFDLITVSGSLYLNHRIMGIYGDSVAVNRDWATRLGCFTKLNELAQKTNAPGNDVFDSKDVAQERARRDAFLDEFRTKLTEIRLDIKHNVAGGDGMQLTAMLDGIARSMREMVLEADAIFAHFEAGEDALAGRRMATMDRKYAAVTTNIGKAVAAIQKIQDQNFSSQLRAASRLRQFEYLIGGLIVCMVLGVTVYGHKISVVMRRNEEELRQAVERAEKALADLESHKLALDEHAIVSVADTAGSIKYANRKFCEASKYAIGEVIGANHRILNSGHHRPEFFREIYEVTSTGRAWHGEIKNRARDGSFYWVDTTIAPLMNTEGEIVEYIAIQTDITRLKEAYLLLRESEKQLVLHRDHLQEMVSAATRKLNQQADQLKEALEKEKQINKLQREFVSMVSHEFRTPLAIIDGSAQRIRRYIDQGRMNPEKLIRRTRKIRDSVERMTRLMNSTLTAARMEEGKIEISIGLCDIGEIVREACARQQEVSPHHTISCDLVDLPAAIRADANALDLVLTNLLSNAVKYAPEAPNIEVRGFKRGDQVVISVRDHGLGIDADDLKRIGERYFRAKTSTGIVGTGIGLNLARTLIEMHGGALEVESCKGSGSTFSVRVPVDGPVDARPTFARAENGEDAARVA